MELAEEKLDEHHLDEKEVLDVVVRFAGVSARRSAHVVAALI